MLTLAPDHRVDWNRILLDLGGVGLSLREITAITGIPTSNLAGYKNGGTEPKHADGEQLLALWRLRLTPTVPVVKLTVRQHHVRG